MGQLFGVYGLIGYLLLVEVRDEVLLGLELGRQLVGADHANGPLLAVGVWVLFHRELVRRFKVISRRLFHTIKIVDKSESPVRDSYLFLHLSGQKNMAGVVSN